MRGLKIHRAGPFICFLSRGNFDAVMQSSGIGEKKIYAIKQKLKPMNSKPRSVGVQVLSDTDVGHTKKSYCFVVAFLGKSFPKPHLVPGMSQRFVLQLRLPNIVLKL